MSNCFVDDTNTLISAILSPFSTNAKAIKKAETLGHFVYSQATWNEFLDLLFRKKFDKYFSLEDRNEMAKRLQKRFILQTVTIEITDCRDAKDNMFLELAVAANAACIITGDDDLLVLNPFRDIPIINASDFLIQF